MLVDVSHTVENGMITYRGLPAPLICDFLSREQSRSLYADGTEFQIGKIEMVANTGTYLDSPFHRLLMHNSTMAHLKSQVSFLISNSFLSQNYATAECRSVELCT